MSGCIPEEQTLALRYSDDGSRLAVLSERQGLRILNLQKGGITRLPEVQPVGNDLSWSPDGQLLATVTAQFGSRDIVVTDLQGSASLLSETPQREDDPMFVGSRNVIYVSALGGQRRLMRAGVGENNPEPVGLIRGYPVIMPSLSPDRKQVAYTTFVDLRPQIAICILDTGQEDLVTSETDPFGLVTSIAPAWNPQQTEVLSLRDSRSDIAVQKSADLAISGQRDPLQLAHEATAIRTVGLGPGSVRTRDLPLKGPAVALDFGPDGKTVFYIADGDLTRLDLRTRREKTLSFEKFRVELAAVRSDRQRVALAAEGQLLALTNPNLDSARFLFLDATDKLLLAEEYFKRGSSGRTMDLYKELAASVTTSEPDHTTFVYLANMIRLGRTREAIESLEKLVANEGLTSEFPKEAIWRVLGFAYFLDLNDLGKAQFSLQKANSAYEARQQKEVEQQELAIRLRFTQRLLGLLGIVRPNPDSSDSGDWQMGNELTSSTLAILSTGRADVIGAFRDAMRARLGADVSSTIRAWGKLLSLAPEIGAVRREYVRALEGYDREVYYFSPSQKPFRPTRSQRVAYLEQFLEIVTDSPESDRVRLELFLLSIETRNFQRARDLLNESIKKDGDRAMEGIPEAFEDFLEKSETQPWLEAAMEGVFLEKSMRPKIEKLLLDPEPALLMGMAAVKTAILKGDVDGARREADLAAAIYGKVPPESRSSRLVYFSARLLAMRAREAALRGLFGESVIQLERAAGEMVAAGGEDVEYLLELNFQAALYANRLRVDDREFLVRRTANETANGDDLVGPNWEVARLRNAVRRAVADFDGSERGSVQRLLAGYDAGIALGKLRLLDESQAALHEVATHPECPPFLKMKALVELAALEESQEDPYTAARRWEVVASDPGLLPIVRNWLAFRIAKAHLQIRYKVAESRAALAALVDSMPNTPLAYQAEDLLKASASPALR